MLLVVSRGAALWRSALLSVVLLTPVQVVAEAIVDNLLFQESFQNFSNGQDPPDWLDTGPLGSLQETPGLFVVEALPDGNQVLSVTSSMNGIHSHLDDAASAGWSSYEFRGRMRMDDFIGGLGVTVYSDYPVSDRYYRLSGNYLGNFALDGGGDCVGPRDTGVPLEIGVWYRFRVQAFPDPDGPGTRVRARVWQDGTPETPGWPADCVDDAPDARVAGSVGVWSYFGAAMGASHWDDLEVYPLEVSRHANELIWSTDYWVHSDLQRATHAETIAQVRALASSATAITFTGDEALDDSYCPIRFWPRRVLEFGPDLPVWEEIGSYNFDVPPGVFLYPQNSGSIAPLYGDMAKVAVGPQFARRDGDWALAHELGHNAGLDHTSELTVMVGAQYEPGTGNREVVRPWQCDVYLDTPADDTARAPCILYDADRLLQGLDPAYPAPRWSPCGGDVSGFCDGEGVCVATQPACLAQYGGGTPAGTDCGYRGLCAVCTGWTARCVPCGELREDAIAGSCGDGVVDPGEDCDDANFYDGDGCSSFCKFSATQAAFSADGDGDGTLDWLDSCPEDPTAEHYDSDGDGLGDGCDACPHDPDPNREAPCDPDGDGDGLSDLIDLCPDLASSDNSDPDRDGIGTPCDVCPMWPDPDHKQDQDSDGDGLGDECECGDANGDGRLNAYDGFRIASCSRGLLQPRNCDASIADANGDGRISAADAFFVHEVIIGKGDPSNLRCERSGY